MATIKTGVLACLVLTSIVLSAMLMSGQTVPEQITPPDEVWFGPGPDMHEVCRPGRVYIIPSRGNVLLLETFSGMYTDLTRAFSQIQFEIDSGSDLWTPGEFINNYPPGVLFRFDYQISRELLARWLTMFYETDFPFAGVDTIFIPLDRGPVQFINSSSMEVWQLQASLAWNVFQRAADEPRDNLSYSWKAMEPGQHYSVAPSVFEIARPEIMAVPGWSMEDINITAVIRSFYLEPALIQEPDGTEIYTDGQQALRVYPSGALEYNIAHLPDSPPPGQDEVIERAVEFIASHGGWPGNVLPTSLGVQQADRVRLEFSPFDLGLPVLEMKPGIVIELEGQEVSYYARELVRAKANEIVRYAEVKPLSWHLSSPGTQAAQYFTAKMVITDLALAYYWHQDNLVPVWRVWVGRQVVTVGAEDGRILHVRTTSGGK